MRRHLFPRSPRVWSLPDGEQPGGRDQREDLGPKTRRDNAGSWPDPSNLAGNQVLDQEPIYPCWAVVSEHRQPLGIGPLQRSEVDLVVFVSPADVRRVVHVSRLMSTMVMPSGFRPPRRISCSKRTISSRRCSGPTWPCVPGCRPLLASSPTIGCEPHHGPSAEGSTFGLLPTGVGPVSSHGDPVPEGSGQNRISSPICRECQTRCTPTKHTEVLYS